MRKKMSSKITAAALTACMVGSLLTGCGSKPADGASQSQGAVDSGTEASSDKQASTGTEAEEPVVIEWLAYNSFSHPDPESPIIKAMEEKYNAKFEFWYVDAEDPDVQLGVQLADGDMPDFMKVRSTNSMETYAKQGILAPITDEMLAKIPHFMEAVEKYDVNGDYFTDTTIDGELYMLTGINLNGSYPTTVAWRQDWLDNVGIGKIPETLEEWEAAMYAFTNDDPDQDGKKNTYGMSNTTMNAIFGAYGAIPLKEFRGTGAQNLFYDKDENGKVVFAATQPYAKEALATLAKWYADGLIDPEFVTGENKGGYWATSQTFENGTVGVTGMSMSNHWAPKFYEDGNEGAVLAAFKAANPGAELGTTVTLGKGVTGPQGKAGTHCWGAVSSASGGFAFTTKCMEDPRKVDVILQMLDDAFADPELAKFLLYGEEGVHHTVNEAGEIAYTEEFADQNAACKEGLNVLNATLTNPEFAKTFNASLYAFMDEHKGPGYSQVAVVNTPSQSAYMTDLQTYTLESYIAIITGEQPVEYFDTFVEGFNKMGGEAIITEINEAMAQNQS